MWTWKTWWNGNEHTLASNFDTMQPRLRILHCFEYGKYGMTPTIERADDVLHAYAIINISIMLLFTSLKKYKQSIDKELWITLCKWRWNSIFILINVLIDRLSNTVVAMGFQVNKKKYAWMHLLRHRRVTSQSLHSFPTHTHLVPVWII